MTLQDIINESGCSYIEIMYRCNSPMCLRDEYTDEQWANGELYGYCYYEDGELHPEDGDNYYLTDVIDHYEWTYTDGYEGQLTVWIEVVWSSDETE